MAHKGVRYPLHFRRDLGLDLFEYSRSWPYAWVQGLGNVSGRYPIELVGHTQFLLPVDEKTRFPPLWRFDFLLSTNQLVRSELEFNTEIDDPSFLATIRFLNEVGAAYAFGTVPGDFRGGYRVLLGHMVKGSAFNANILSFGPGEPSAFYSFLDWDEYNNL